MKRETLLKNVLLSALPSLDDTNVLFVLTLEFLAINSVEDIGLVTEYNVVI